MNKFDRFAGCIMGGAIGDAYGGQYENQPKAKPSDDLFVWGNIEEKREFFLSDDTQLTLATCESIIEQGEMVPEALAQKFVEWHRKGKLSGLGASTLQAIKGLTHGGHWWLVGRKGEYAAGNGAAMRIAPLGFLKQVLTRDKIRDVCRITHHNDEAYAGALAVVVAIQLLLAEGRSKGEIWLRKIAQSLPDTNTRDRIIEMSEISDRWTIPEACNKFGNSGYVVESVPVALLGVVKSWEMGFEAAIESIISCGGDADTNASIMGQVAGSELGYSSLPDNMVAEIEKIAGYIEIQNILGKWESKMIVHNE